MENNILLYTDENGKTDISVRFAEEDVWVAMEVAKRMKPRKARPPLGICGGNTQKRRKIMPYHIKSELHYTTNHFT